jgi:deoxyribodipyrimidine photolyase
MIAAMQDASDIVGLFVFDTEILAQFPEQDRRVGFLLDAVKQLENELHTL